MNAKEFFDKYLNDLSLPVSFIIGGRKFVGLHDFHLSERNITESDYGKQALITADHGDLRANTILNLYEKHNALDYTLHLTWQGQKNSPVIKKFLSVDGSLPGKDPVMRGIFGDHEKKYLPYEKKLTEGKLSFRSPLGRATHWYFPFFDWNSDGEGVRLALGWGGTWSAEFSYLDGKTAIRGESTLGLKTYLKPGETIRSARVGMLFYKGGEEEGVNAWRRFVVDCVMPKENGAPIKPFITTCLAADTGRPNSDGSVSEYDGSYKRSFDAFYGEGLHADFRWFDAGWYFDSNGKTIPSKWHETGSWELDTEKWKGDSFRDSVRYARAHGTKTLVWFEPEAVTGIDGLVTHYGYEKKMGIGEALRFSRTIDP